MNIIRPKIKVDFNELIDRNLVLLSKNDVKTDDAGNEVLLHQGLEIEVYDEDFDANGQRDDLIAMGTVELNVSDGWSRHVKWCCRIDDNGILHNNDRS